MTEYLLPKRIVKNTGATNVEILFHDRPLQTPVLLGNYDNSVDNVVLSDGGYLMLDFGKEISGGVNISVQSADGAKLRVKFGESVTEAMAEIGEKNLNNYHSIIEYVIPALSLSSQRVGDTGFRFVKVEALGGNVSIRGIRAVSEITDSKEIGYFECNDDRINEVWKTAVYTVKLNMHDYLIEGLKRDRLVWIGDIHPEVSTVKTVFGKDKCVEKSLDMVRDTTLPDKWMNNTGTYSMWWIIVHYDWYMHWGDLEYLKKQTECLKHICDMAFSWIAKGLNDVPDGMINFVDWSSKGTASEFEGRKAVFCLGVDAALKLFEILGDSEYAQRCAKYRDILRNEKVKCRFNKRVSALSVLSGRDADIAKKVISGNSPEEMSTFLGYYVLKAKAMCGEYADNIDILKNYWGAMLDKGATTFWEDFDIKWVKGSGRIDEIPDNDLKDIHGDYGRHCYTGFRHSLCHGWASGPAPYLTEQVGGIEILEPGCKKLKISPKLDGLEWIKVKYPTPYGIVKIESKMKDGNVETNIEAPKEITIVE